MHSNDTNASNQTPGIIHFLQKICGSYLFILHQFKFISIMCLSVGAFSQNEPDYYSGKFSFFFFRETTECMRSGHFLQNYKSTGPASGIASELVQRVPPFVYSIFNVRYKTGRDYRVPPLNFFPHCATFFCENFFVSKGSPFNFLDILQQTGFSQSRKSPLLQFLKLCVF